MLTQDGNDDGKHNKTEYGFKICLVQDGTSQLCERTAKRHEAHASEREAYKQDKKVPPGLF